MVVVGGAGDKIRF